MGKSNRNTPTNNGVQNNNDTRQGQQSASNNTLGDGAIQELITNNHNETITNTENKTNSLGMENNQGQITNTLTEIGVRDSEINNQNYIGLQGDDLANFMNALNQKDAISQTALLSQNNQLKGIIDSNNATTQNTVNTLKQGGKWGLVLLALGGMFIAYKVIKK